MKFYNGKIGRNNAGMLENLMRNIYFLRCDLRIKLIRCKVNQPRLLQFSNIFLLFGIALLFRSMPLLFQIHYNHLGQGIQDWTK